MVLTNITMGTQDTFRNCFAPQEIFICEDADYQQLSCSGVDVHIIKGHNKESKIYTISDGVDTIFLYNTERIVNGDIYELSNTSDGYEFLAIRSTHTNTTKSINFDDWRNEGKTYFTAHPLGTMLGVAKSPVRDERV